MRFIETVHPPNINEDKHHKEVNGALLGKPKARLNPPNRMALSSSTNDARAKGHEKPYDQ